MTPRGVRPDTRNVLGVLAIRIIGRSPPVQRGGDRVLAGLLDWIALGAVIGAVWGISAIHSWSAWLLAPLIATVLYLVIASLQLAVLTIREDRNRADGR